MQPDLRIGSNPKGHRAPPRECPHLLPQVGIWLLLSMKGPGLPFRGQF